MSEWTRGLNSEQCSAVMHAQGPLLILAGAGSGKTTVLVARAGQLLQTKGVAPSEICVLTFTTKAARELKHRVSRRVGSRADGLWTGTFHSFGLSLLRQHHKEAGLSQGFGVIDQGDSVAIVKELMSNVRNSAKDAFRADQILSIINALRGRSKPADFLGVSDEYLAMAQTLMPKYTKRLEALGVTDYEGLLIKPIELLQNNSQVRNNLQQTFKYIMVDEFQDTNPLQFELLQILSEQHQNLAVVGDDDQSIYGWRGACVRHILDFPKLYRQCTVVRLERNYRSSQAILDVANNVIAKNELRHPKTLQPSRDDVSGEKPELFVYENDDVEVEEVVGHIRYFLDREFKYRDIAVIYRTNGQGGLLESQLRQCEIPYALTGGQGFFDRKEIKDVMAFLRCSIAPNEMALRRIINVPMRGVGEGTVERLTKFAETQGLRFHVAARRWRLAGIRGVAGEGLESLFQLLDHLAEDLLSDNPSHSAGESLMEALRRMGYREYLAPLCRDPQALESRWKVLETFAQALDRALESMGRTEGALLRFLDSMELMDTVEEVENQKEADKVQLLTLHACKGLEFPVVIFIGCEENIIPHRTLGVDVSEERRLFYVGVTRAQDRLIFTRAKARKRFGKWVPTTPSRFLLEIQPSLLTTFETGYRPVGALERQNMMADLYKKLEQTAVTQKIN